MKKPAEIVPPIPGQVEPLPLTVRMGWTALAVTMAAAGALGGVETAALAHMLLAWGCGEVQRRSVTARALRTGLHPAAAAAATIGLPPRTTASGATADPERQHRHAFRALVHGYLVPAHQHRFDGLLGDEPCRYRVRRLRTRVVSFRCRPVPASPAV